MSALRPAAVFGFPVNPRSTQGADAHQCHLGPAKRPMESPTGRMDRWGDGRPLWGVRALKRSEAPLGWQWRTGWPYGSDVGLAAAIGDGLVGELIKGQPPEAGR